MKTLHAASCGKLSQLSNGEKTLKLFQQLTKLPSAIQYRPNVFLDHPVVSYDTAENIHLTPYRTLSKLRHREGGDVLTLLVCLSVCQRIRPTQKVVNRFS